MYRGGFMAKAFVLIETAVGRNKEVVALTNALKVLVRQLLRV
jgi:hypothetical protein